MNRHCRARHRVVVQIERTSYIRISRYVDNRLQGTPIHEKSPRSIELYPSRTVLLPPLNSA
ncbi:hypothetical protein WG66_008290 [Moniliophthora roreri]|nr:hypothetical protein WG66_008290 [Moniliophthora roreri]